MNYTQIAKQAYNALETENKQDLIQAITSIQNLPYYANQDILTIVGLMTNKEIRKHLSKVIKQEVNLNKYYLGVLLGCIK